MSEDFPINYDELVSLLKAAFEEGCGGYPDLKDAYCENAAAKWLAARKQKTKEASQAKLKYLASDNRPSAPLHLGGGTTSHATSTPGIVYDGRYVLQGHTQEELLNSMRAASNTIRDNTVVGNGNRIIMDDNLNLNISGSGNRFVSQDANPDFEVYRRNHERAWLNDVD